VNVGIQKWIKSYSDPVITQCDQKKLPVWLTGILNDAKMEAQEQHRQGENIAVYWE